MFDGVAAAAAMIAALAAVANLPSSETHDDEESAQHQGPPEENGDDSDGRNSHGSTDVQEPDDGRNESDARFTINMKFNGLDITVNANK